MKRGILLIVMLIFIVDFAEDGYLGSFTSAPVQAAVSQTFSHFTHHPAKHVTSSLSEPASEGCGRLSPRQAEAVISLGQIPLKIMTACNNGDAGGIPR